MTCSARSLGSAISSAASRASSRSTVPRGRVPAIGRTVTSPSSTRTMTSGEAPASAWSPRSRKNMYGDGLTVRRQRYTFSGAAASPSSKRWASTTWMTSPARMYSFARSTIAWYPSSVKFDRTSPATPAIETGVAGGMPRRATSPSMRVTAASYASSRERSPSRWTFATTWILCATLSKTRRLSASSRQASGRPTSSAARTGNRSKERAMSYPT